MNGYVCLTHCGVVSVGCRAGPFVLPRSLRGLPSNNLPHWAVAGLMLAYPIGVQLVGGWGGG